MGIILIYSSFILLILSLILFVLSHKFSLLSKIALFISYFSITSVLITFIYYVYIFITNQFIFENVYKYTNLAMPKILLFTSIWAGKSGSLLLWLLFNSIVLFISLLDKNWRKYTAPILIIFQLIILSLFFSSKPFLLTEMLASDGLGLNPILSHPLMYIHPPFAFLGYGFLTLTFAYSMAGLISNNFSQWINKAYKWAILSCFGFTVAIILGSLWAYEAAGWGGYWAFDPIENGTLISWLLIVILIHNFILFRRHKKGLRVSFFITILSFSSIMHIVFLVRSGLLSSISTHSYVEKGLIPGLITIELVSFIIPLIIYFSKLKMISDKKIKNNFLTDDFVIFISMIISFVFALILIVGTNFPLLTFISGNAKNIDLNYFKISFLLFGVLLALSISHGNLIKNHRTLKLYMYFNKLTKYIVISLVLTLIFYYLTHLKVDIPGFIVTNAGFLLISTSLRKLKKINLLGLGDRLSHIGIGLLLIGIFFSSMYSSSTRVNLFINQPYYHSKYSLIINDIKKEKKYIGNAETYGLEIKGLSSNDLVELKPAFWKYEKNGNSTLLGVPSTKILLLRDIQAIPVGENDLTIKIGEEKQLPNIIIKLLNIDERKEKELIKQELTFKINYKNNESLLFLNRAINSNGMIIYSHPAMSDSINELVELKNYNKDTGYVTISLPSARGSVEFEIIEKPLMNVVRSGYYLLIIGTLIVFLKRILIKEKRGD